MIDLHLSGQRYLRYFMQCSHAWIRTPFFVWILVCINHQLSCGFSSEDNRIAPPPFPLLSLFCFLHSMSLYRVPDWSDSINKMPLSETPPESLSSDNIMESKHAFWRCKWNNQKNRDIVLRGYNNSNFPPSHYSKVLPDSLLRF